jgi:hypothetical protein
MQAQYYLQALLSPRQNLMMPSTSPLHMSCRHLRSDSLTQRALLVPVAALTRTHARARAHTHTHTHTHTTHTHTHTPAFRPWLEVSSRARAITQGGQYVTGPFQMLKLAIEYAGRNHKIKTDHKSSETWQSSNIFEWHKSQLHSWGN